MTIPAFARELGGRFPAANETAAAKQLRQVIASQATTGAKLLVLDGKTQKPTEIVLTPALSGLLLDLLRYIGDGDAVTIIPISRILTTQQAADILNVSRPFLISLLEKGIIKYTTVGRHRRITAEDLFRYKRERDETRGKALSELAELDADIL